MFDLILTLDRVTSEVGMAVLRSKQTRAVGIISKYT